MKTEKGKTGQGAIEPQIRYEIELVAIICDNCPVQVNGLVQALAFVPNLAILHISCLSHMANLVFTHTVLGPLVSARIALLNEFVYGLRSPEGLTIAEGKCPTLVKTRWIYAADVLDFIFRYRNDVNFVRSALFHNPVPTMFKRLYWILLSLNLFSRAVEARDQKLHEAIPLSREVIPEFQAVRAPLGDDDDVHILDLVTAYFIAEVRTNVFETMIMA
jgi:hypothetical protein